VSGEGGVARYAVLRPALLLTCGRLLAFGASFFIPVVLARVFTVPEFGTYKQVFLLFATLYYGPPLALATSLYYFVPRAPENAGRYVANALLALGVTGGLVAVAVASAPGFLTWVFSNPALAPCLPALGLYLLLMMLSAPLEIVLICRKRIAGASWAYALTDLVRAACLILPAVLTRDLVWVTWGAALAALLRAVALAAYLRRETFGRLALDRALLGEQLRYTLPFGFAVILGTAQMYLHQYVVAHTFDAATFAVYSVGCLQIPLIDFVATPTCDVMMVQMAEALRAGRAAEVLASWRDAVEGLALLFFPMVGALVLVAHDLIVLLYTERYVASVPIFMLWCSVIVLLPSPAESVLRVYARTRLIVLVNAVQLATIALLIVPCLRLLGLPGAVLVTLLGLAVARVFALVRIRGLMGATWRDVLPWRALGLLAVAALGAFVAGAAVRRVAPAGLLGMAVDGGAYALAYWALAHGLGVAPDVAGWVRRRWGRSARRRISASTAEAEA
jgi:O-antigen/teichoic acid export membrane protein